MKYLVTLYLIFSCTNAFAIGSRNVCLSKEVASELSSLSTVSISELQESMVQYTVTVPDNFHKFKFSSIYIVDNLSKIIEIENYDKNNWSISGNFIMKKQGKQNKQSITLNVQYSSPHPEWSDQNVCKMSLIFDGELKPY